MTVPGMIVTVQAPAGYGKTTLLSQWARAKREHGETVQWLSLADHDIRNLPRVVEALLGDSGDATIIIDDCNNRLAETAVKELVAERGEHAIVVSGRCGLDSIASDLAITATDLRLESHEVAELADLLDVDDYQSRAPLLKSLSGWPLGTRVALSAHRDGADAGEVLGQLAATIYDNLPGDLAKKALFAAASLDVVRPELLGDALGISCSDAETTMKRLQAEGVVEAVTSSAAYGDDEREVHTHYAVREGLRAGLMHQGSHHWEAWELRELKRRHALARGDESPPQAVADLVALGAFKDAQDVAHVHFQETLDGGETTLEAVRNLPLEQLEEHPTLMLVRLVLERPLPSTPASLMEDLAGRLHRVLTERSASPDLQVAVPSAASKIAVERMLGMWDAALGSSVALMEQMADERLRQGVLANPKAPILYAVISLTGVLVGDLNVGLEAARWGLDIALEQGNVLEQVHALSLAALAHSLQGEGDAAAAALERADALAANAEFVAPEFSWTDGDIARVFTAYQKGDCAPATGALERLIPAMDRMEQWPMVVMAESLVTGRLRGSGHALVQMNSRMRQAAVGRVLSPYWQLKLGWRLADLATTTGRYKDAAKQIASLSNLPGSQESTGLRQSRARLALFQGQYEDAARIAAQVPAGTSARTQQESELVAALAQYGMGNREAAQQTLQGLQASLTPVALDALVGTVPYEMFAEVADDLGMGWLVEALQATRVEGRAHQYGALSKAEIEVLQALTKNKTMVETASDLYLSPNTLKSHCRSIYAKLRAPSRGEALTTAHMLGLLT
ncbi:LuxR C-terminal-related transcriptional regulator [Schaalia sp. JY-X169]|uniref:helix-turn-helix transcriptional regulator n=1 Tax=Schaalia sp. JY-X169 TaxID=2758572 RepID=UPI0015F510CA|nr:LuxR C-terminal-related transcriptional regulator [Schaalia sp. JY-X169]